MSMEQLKKKLGQIEDLGSAESLLSWDQETKMPEEAARIRGIQMSTLAGLSHELFTSAEMGQLLKEVKSADQTEQSILEVSQYDYEKATKLPTEFVEKRMIVQNEAHHAWLEGRKNKDFSSYAPYLEKVMTLARQGADYLGYEDHPYDALLNNYERGMKSDQVKTVFADLRDRTLPLVKKIAEAGDAADYGILTRPFPAEGQKAFAWELAGKAFGLLPAFARQDESAHPFCTSFDRSDIRITTRTEEYWPACLFGTWHEAGHAMYERGVSERWERTPVAAGTSLGVHESQSRMFENLLARSLPFWKKYFGELQKVAPEVCEGIDAEILYKAVNRVEPSFIRVEADEVTYNFHVMLRFELEMALLEGDLKVVDLPEAWNAKMQDYLGLTPPDDAMGVLQDVHWSAGLIGYFPTYTLGNLLSVQLLEAAKKEGQIAADVEQANYDSLSQWLVEHVHQHGRSLTPSELTERATGQALIADPYVDYLWKKYGEIYGIEQ